jgi:hypothetical protein
MTAVGRNLTDSQNGVIGSNAAIRPILTRLKSVYDFINWSRKSNGSQTSMDA